MDQTDQVRRKAAPNAVDSAPATVTEPMARHILLGHHPSQELDVVEEQSWQSFPASDPPSWAGSSI